MISLSECFNARLLQARTFARTNTQYSSQLNKLALFMKYLYYLQLETSNLNLYYLQPETSNQ